MFLSQPNTGLSEHDKFTKRDLKKQLKLQSRIRKLEHKLHQAELSDDQELAVKTRVALLKLQETCQNPAVLDGTSFGIRPSYVGEAEARAFVERLVQQIRILLIDHSEITTKEYCAQQARELLLNMSKATQTKEMFLNEAALLGYSSHKFTERAMLMVHSLGKLWSVVNSVDKNCTDLQQMIMGRLKAVRSICSIGCGPGCEAVGVAKFLFSISGTGLHRAVLLDWMIDQWKLVIDPMMSLLVPDMIKAVDMASCDVRQPLNHSSNHPAHALAFGLHDRSTSKSSVDLFVTSYVLSETREKWYTFYQQLIDQSATYTLFLFADPTAWQFHLLIQRCGVAVDFVWLDSSMKYPDLQVLDRRVGPSVLIGMKR